ncbi:2-dehydro-3-deoxygluconokinase [Cyclobacterium lianum]|uniref:2-dehydro-3-deoxygluconokinase n=1 Tax=Cyclobacterium lianum TaxID=388280 RepID=A0A1M7KWV1_9BACT|nr:sugar kinase [Cyclobacterium lianum]SHM69969.1 2-dehydro-3-deoxygluconokinase [Cyclobacterium lianum]
MRKRIVTLGEIMMRFSTPGHERFIQAGNYDAEFGGSEANVGVSLAYWQQDVSLISALPENDLGRAAMRYLRTGGIDTSYIATSEGRMGLYFLENGAMQRSSKIIYDRFDSVFSHYEGLNVDWDQVFKGVDWFHWSGITPALSGEAASLCLRVLQAAKRNGVTISGDINYRRNLWRYGITPLEIMPELIAHSQVIIAGLTDLANCMNIHETSFQKACQKAKDRCPSIQLVATTERESLSASHNRLTGHLWGKDQTIQSKTYDMPNIVDRIGGGDAFMAGLIYGLMHRNQKEALEFAVAASVLKHSVPGDANFVTVDEVDQLVRGENIGRLLR